MASMLPNTSSCCECGAPTNLTTLETYLQNNATSLETLGLIYVTTLAALRDYPTSSSNRFAIVEGRLTQTDGLTAWYDWQPGNTDADDNEVTIRPDDYVASIGGTWRRLGA